jgi:hypothetical protein
LVISIRSKDGKNGFKLAGLKLDGEGIIKTEGFPLSTEAQ